MEFFYVVDKFHRTIEDKTKHLLEIDSKFSWKCAFLPYLQKILVALL